MSDYNLKKCVKYVGGEPVVMFEKGDWNEDQHPRGDNGRFGVGAGGGDEGNVYRDQNARAQAASDKAKEASARANSTGKSADHRMASAAHQVAFRERQLATKEANKIGEKRSASIHSQLANEHWRTEQIHSQNTK